MKDGTLAAAQVSTQGEALKKLTESLNDAEQKFAEVKNHYGSQSSGVQEGAVPGQGVEAQIEQHARRASPSASRSNIARR